MDRIQLQKLRDLPIEGVAERLGLRVTRHKSLCPFHDDRHPSLSFHRQSNSFHCFVCGAKGGNIDLVMRHLHKDFKEACRWLADENNIILEEWKQLPARQQPRPFEAQSFERFFRNPRLSPEAERFLYGERKIDPRVVRWCRLTSWRDSRGTEWLQIPFYDLSGRLTGVQNRNLTPCALPRFKFPYGSQCTIYNLPVLSLLSEGQPLFITEGCSDCWAMLSAGHKAIAIPSATLLQPKDKALLQQLSREKRIRFGMFPDRDAPGERLFLQLKEVLPDLVHYQLPPDCKDFADYYLQSRSSVS